MKVLELKTLFKLNWRSASARISRALLLECVPLHHECKFDQSDLTNQQTASKLVAIRTLLHNCSNGSLIQNEKLFFDALLALLKMNPKDNKVMIAQKYSWMRH